MEKTISPESENQSPSQVDGLFVTDLDGTLLTSERTIRHEDFTSLAHLRKSNRAVAIATGRSLFSFTKLMDGLGLSGAENPLCVDYVIFSTGAGIIEFSSGKLLRSFSLSQDDVVTIYDYLEGLEIDYMIHKPVPHTRSFLYRYKGGKNPDFHARLDLYGQYGQKLHSRKCVERFGSATEVLCIAPSEKGHELAAIISEDLKNYNVIKATSPLDLQSVWIEIFPKTVSKSQATSWLSNALGVERSRVCAVGNDYNDEDLLHWAEHSFIMSNGPQSMKTGHIQVADNNNCGVSEAINGWLRCS